MSEDINDEMHFRSINNGRSVTFSYMDRRRSVFAESYNPEEDDFEPPITAKTDDEKFHISSVLKNNFLFRNIQEEDFDRIIDAMFKKTVAQGEIILKPGDESEFFFCIDSGVFEDFVIENGVKKILHLYDSSGCFGELALMYNVPRSSSLVAVTDGSLWALDRRTFRKTVLKGAFKKRVMYESLLERLPILKKLSKQEKMNLAEALVDKTFQDGDRIVGEGDAANGVYFIVSGCVRITKRETGTNNEIEVRRLSQGDFFGEICLVNKIPKFPSAYASGKVQIAFLEVDTFERLLGPCLDFVKRRFNNYEQQLLNLFDNKQD